MATGKRYYWIKLRDNFFDDDGPADFLMSQPNGANYVVLYQMLCLKTINTGGRLENRIGEVIIKYDIAKIQRACKYFTADTVRVALELYKALGLIYEDINGMLVIANHNAMVGSETDWAAKKQRQRIDGKPPEQLPTGDTAMDNSGDNGGDNVPIEIRDKEIRDIEIRDKSKETIIADPSGSARQTDVRRIVDEWNKYVDVSPISRISPDSTRYKLLCARLKDYGLERVVQAVRNVAASSFLRGQSNSGWVITFDWFVKPNNFIKVLEGNYSDRKEPGHGGADGRPERSADADTRWGISGNNLT